jgi:hypothetical protein
MENGFLRDVICNVLSKECSKNVIAQVLKEFIPDYKRLNTDYATPPDEINFTFKSEDEMIIYFIENKNIGQTFYWNQNTDNPDRIMVGADITSDNKLIMSLTIDGFYSTAVKYYEKLKSLLKSEIGVISYTDPPEYENGADFIRRYKV